MLCSRCVYDAHPHLKPHAPKPHLGCILFSFFWLSKSTVGENGGIVQKVMAFRTKKFRNNKSNCIARRQAVLVSWMHPEKGGIPPDFRCSGTLVAE